MIGNRKIVSLCISRIQDASSYEYAVALNKKILPLVTVVFYQTEPYPFRISALISLDLAC